MTNYPDYFNETYESILQRMLSKIPDTIDKTEGSFIYDALAPVAAELAQLVIVLKSLLDKAFVQSTYDEYLDMKAREFGLERRQAKKATGQVIFIGKPGTVIPAGIRVSTVSDNGESGTIFLTKTNAEIGADGTAIVDIEAEEEGKQGNVAAGAIQLLLDKVDGIEKVTNLLATSGGTDREDDESLRQRILEKVRHPGASGNKSDYINWALEVPGVGGVRVIPLWDGPGTVKVVLLGTDKKPASQAIVDAVQKYIAPVDGSGKAPIGARVTVVAAKAVPIDVSAKVILSGTRTLAEIQTSFQAALANYLAEIAFSDDPSVRYVRVGALLLDQDGVKDYTDLLINGAVGNVEIREDEVAIVGTVTLI